MSNSLDPYWKAFSTRIVFGAFATRAQEANLSMFFIPWQVTWDKSGKLEAGKVTSINEF